MNSFYTHPVFVVFITLLIPFLFRILIKRIKRYEGVIYANGYKKGVNSLEEDERKKIKKEVVDSLAEYSRERMHLLLLNANIETLSATELSLRNMLEGAKEKVLKESLRQAVQKTIDDEVFIKLRYLLESEDTVLETEELAIKKIVDKALHSLLSQKLSEAVDQGVRRKLEIVLQNNYLPVFINMPSLQHYFNTPEELYQKFSFWTARDGSLRFGPYETSHAVLKSALPEDAVVINGLYVEWSKVADMPNQVVSKANGVRVNRPNIDK
jgi:hypothetical protein